MILLYALGMIGVLLVLAISFLGVCSLFVDPQKEYEEHSPFYRFLLNVVTAIAIKVMRIHIHVSGLEKIPEDTKKLLFVSNHRSNFDPIVTWYVLKKWQPAYISKSSNFKIPIFGRIIRKCCFLQIDRENPRNALKTILKAAAILKKGEVSMAVYPEGTRSKECILLPFHNGVFKIAQEAETPIVILCISGTENVHKNYPLRHTDVYLEVIEFLPKDIVKKSKTASLGAHIYSAMEDKLGL